MLLQIQYPKRPLGCTLEWIILTLFCSFFICCYVHYAHAKVGEDIYFEFSSSRRVISLKYQLKMNPVPLKHTYLQLRLCAGVIKTESEVEIKQSMTVRLSKLWSWRKLLVIEAVLFEYVLF